jgi:sugar phosphate isomerase/epimerase
MHKQKDPVSGELLWSRRAFAGAIGTGLAAVTVAGPVYGSIAASSSREPGKVCVFSKHLQWLDWQGLAETAAAIGFDGVDLTVRKGGHVEPERAAEDLPRAVEAIRKAGLTVPMVTAGIVDVRTPHAELIMQAMKSAQIRLYRWGGFRYEDNQSIPSRLEELKREVGRLADLNRKYDLCAMYHTHSGLEVGASIWDLWLLLKDLDSSLVSVNLDLAHATIEGGSGGYVNNTRLVATITRGIAVKDFTWRKNDKGEWRPVWCPLGEGMVNFKRFFSILKAAGFSGPIQLHFEYSLGGAENGGRSLSIDRKLVIEAMRRDLKTLRGWLTESGI